MHDFRVLVRQRFSGSRALSDQAVEELAQHVEETWRAARAGGKSDEDALALAREQLDRPARCPPTWWRRRAPASGLVSTAWRDIRYAVRMLAARPGFTAVAVITLGLGIGANTAIFSVVRSLLLEPLPFRDPDRLVMLWETTANEPETAYRERAELPRLAEEREVVRGDRDLGDPELQLLGRRAKRSAYQASACRRRRSACSASPRSGRTFMTEEDRPGHDVAVISFGLWQRRYGGRPDIVGPTRASTGGRSRSSG